MKENYKVEQKDKEMETRSEKLRKWENWFWKVSVE